LTGFGAAHAKLARVAASATSLSQAAKLEELAWVPSPNSAAEIRSADRDETDDEQRLHNDTTI